MVGVGEPVELVDVSGLALSTLAMERSGVLDRDQFASQAPTGSSSQSLGRGGALDFVQGIETSKYVVVQTSQELSLHFVVPRLVPRARYPASSPWVIVCALTRVLLAA